MKKTILIGGGLVLGAVLVAGALGFYLSQRAPTVSNQTPFEPILDPDDKPGTYLCRLTFQEENGRGWQYGVVTYGRKVRLEPGPGSFKVLVDGAPVEVAPADGVLWAIGPDLQLHRLGLAFRDVSEAIERSEAGEFVHGPFWKERLKPQLEQYRWPEK